MADIDFNQEISELLTDALKDLTSDGRAKLATRKIALIAVGDHDVPAEGGTVVISTPCCTACDQVEINFAVSGNQTKTMRLVQGTVCAAVDESGDIKALRVTGTVEPGPTPTAT